MIISCVRVSVGTTVNLLCPRSVVRWCSRAAPVGAAHLPADRTRVRTSDAGSHYVMVLPWVFISAPARKKKKKEKKNCAFLVSHKKIC